MPKLPDEFFGNERRAAGYGAEIDNISPMEQLLGVQTKNWDV